VLHCREVGAADEGQAVVLLQPDGPQVPQRLARQPHHATATGRPRGRTASSAAAAGRLATRRRWCTTMAVQGWSSGVFPWLEFQGTKGFLV
jgi:hypothetical protein